MATKTPVIKSFLQDSNFVGDGVTNANQLTLSGTAAPNTTVLVFDGATQIGTASVNASGSWSFTTATLQDGWHPFTAINKDAIGATSSRSAAFGVQVDTRAPSPPTIIGYSPDTGTIGDGNTSATVLTLTGTGEANSTALIYDGATLLGTAYVNTSGNWSFQTGTLSGGVHKFTATDKDWAGNTSAASTALNVTIGSTSPPPAPVISSFSPDSNFVGDGVTNANLLTLSGTAAPNTTVLVFDGATQIGTAIVNASGSWTFATAILPDGQHLFTAIDRVANGSTSAPSVGLTLSVDTRAPNAPTIIGFSPDTGTIGDGNTSATVLTLSGTGEAKSTVLVYDGTTLLGTALVGTNGTWSLQTGTLSGGVHKFTATDKDAAGNTSAASTALNVTIGSTSPPPAPVISSFSPDSNFVGDGVTNANLLTLSGTAAPNTTVLVFDGATQIGTAIVNASGSWTFATAILPDGQHLFTAIDRVANGSTSAPSVGLTLSVDTRAPNAPAIIGFSPDTGTIGDGNTSATVLTLSGTGEAKSTVLVYDGTTLLGTALVGTNGTWSLQTGTLSGGVHKFTATDKDAAGNTSAASTALNVTIGSTSPPPTPVISSFSPDSNFVGDGITNANLLTLSGTAAPNTTVLVFDGASQIGTATVSASGSWMFTTAILQDGWHPFTVIDKAANGATSAPSAAFGLSVDTRAPNAPAIIGFSPDTGTIGDGNTSANALTLSGTGEANSTALIYDGTTMLGTAYVAANGTWSLQTGTLSGGIHKFTATDKDWAGNTSTPSAALNVTIGSGPPVPIIASFFPDSNVGGDGITNGKVLTLTGTAVASTNIQVYDGATLIGSTPVNGSGAWSFTTVALADGVHRFTAKDMDSVGNLSAASLVVNVTVDTVAPMAPTLSSYSSSTMTLAGMAEASSTIKVYDGNTAIGTATANASGAWSFVTGSLTSGNHSLVATDMDGAGNVSSMSSALSITVNSSGVPPAAPTISKFFADSGTLGDGITSANVLTLTGAVAADSLVKVYDGSSLLGTTTASGAGIWSFETGALSDSTHLFSATATNTSGSTSAQSAVMSVKVVPSVTDFAPAPNNWSDPIHIDNVPWYIETAGRPWSLTNPDTHTVRTEVRSGDLWASPEGDDTSRAEILSAAFPDGLVFNVAYTMTVEPGTLNLPGFAWLSLTQFHESGPGAPPLSIMLKGENMEVVLMPGTTASTLLYHDPNPIQRGHAYDFQIQLKFDMNGSGFLDIWRDGVEIVDYHGTVGTDAGTQYLKFGIYRGWPGDANYTMAVDYSNIVISADPNFPLPSSGSGISGAQSNQAALTSASTLTTATSANEVAINSHDDLAVNGRAVDAPWNPVSTVTASDQSASSSQSIGGPSLLSAIDTHHDMLMYSLYEHTPGPASDHLSDHLDGAVQSGSAHVEVPSGLLAHTNLATDANAEDLFVTAYDVAILSIPKEFHIDIV